jgi:anti-anti-sigma factor
VACPRLWLDLARVRFLTSTVLGQLVGLHRRVRAAGGELTLLNVAGDVYEVFVVTRLHQLLDVRRLTRARPRSPEGGSGRPASPLPARAGSPP